MKFDVIIGNPPYQLSDGSGGSSDSAIPVYNLFVKHAMMLLPRFLIMIVPSKWMVGGRGLKPFRKEMMEDTRLKVMYDFEDASDCFPGLHIDGGVCYFLWDKNYDGMTHYIYRTSNGIINESDHFLKNKYFQFVIRDNRVLSIIGKSSKGKRFSSFVSNVRPYGIRGYLFNEPERYPDSNLKYNPYEGALKIYGVKGIKGGARRIIGYILPKIVTSNVSSINKWKLFFTTSYSTNAINPPEVIIGEPKSICTETFLLIGPFDNEQEQLNCLSYINTNYFKVLLYFGKGTMHVNKDVFGLIPLQDFSEPWTDEKLYKKYDLTTEEISFIESMVLKFD
jgi:hypothetical protein